MTNSEVLPPKINVKVEILLPPYAGGVYYITPLRIEYEDDGSITVVITKEDIIK